MQSCSRTLHLKCLLLDRYEHERSRIQLKYLYSCGVFQDDRDAVVEGHTSAAGTECNSITDMMLGESICMH